MKNMVDMDLVGTAHLTLSVNVFLPLIGSENEGKDDEKPLG